MNKNAKIYVAGHLGLVGSAIIRKLQQEGFHNLLTRTRQELDLIRQEAVEQFFAQEKPEYVILAAAKVGGIQANDFYRADFIYENLQIQNNIIYNAYKQGVAKLLFLGSSCIYPKLAPQPLKEEYLLTGLLEPTNEAYAVAKIAGIIMCQSYNRQYGTQFLSIMPTNLYGPFDNFDLNNSHVLPAMIRKFHEAKVSNNAAVTLWGSGKPMREFLYSEDMADASLFALQQIQVGDTPSDLYNIGSGKDIPIKELALLIQKIVGHQGDIHWDSSKPDGTPRKLMDVQKMTDLGWKAKTSLPEGIEKTYQWFLANLPKS